MTDRVYCEDCCFLHPGGENVDSRCLSIPHFVSSPMRRTMRFNDNYVKNRNNDCSEFKLKKKKLFGIF